MKNCDKKKLSKDSTACKIAVTKNVSKEYRAYLLDNISEPSDYTQLIEVLKNAGEDDIVKIVINSPGGDIDTTIQLVSAIKNSVCIVETMIEGSACSAASLIFLAGDKFAVAYGSYMLCHFYSAVDFGKGHELKSSVDFRDAHLKKYFSVLYKDFLSPDELKRMFAGEDFWFDHEEIVRRLKKNADLIGETRHEKKTKAKAEKHEKTQKEKDVVK